MKNIALKAFTMYDIDRIMDGYIRDGWTRRPDADESYPHEEYDYSTDNLNDLEYLQDINS